MVTHAWLGVSSAYYPPEALLVTLKVARRSFDMHKTSQLDYTLSSTKHNVDKLSQYKLAQSNPRSSVEENKATFQSTSQKVPTLLGQSQMFLCYSKLKLKPFEVSNLSQW